VGLVRVLQGVSGELATDRPGSDVLASRLIELLFVGVLRAWLGAARDVADALAALAAGCALSAPRARSCR
jgi:hypothetical protein